MASASASWVVASASASWVVASASASASWLWPRPRPRGVLASLTSLHDIRLAVILATISEIIQMLLLTITITIYKTRTCRSVASEAGRATKDCYLQNRTLRSSLCLLGHLYLYLKAELRYIKFKILGSHLGRNLGNYATGVIDFRIFDLSVSQFILLNTLFAFISNSRAEIRLN